MKINTQVCGAYATCPTLFGRKVDDSVFPRGDDVGRKSKVRVRASFFCFLMKKGALVDDDLLLVLDVHAHTYVKGATLELPVVGTFVV